MSSPRVKRFAALALLLWIAPAPARAQVADAGASEADGLAAEVDRDGAETVGSDCAIVCRALEAMRRATDRLCSAEPGDRCASARDKVKKSTERVRAACPDCVAASVTTEGRLEERAPGEATIEAASPKRGCAGCATQSPREGAAETIVLAAVLALAIRRRRR